MLARSHELVAYARLGPIRREGIEQAYWGEASSTFEYWSHAACVLPLEEWPAYALARRAREAKGRRWHRLEDVARSCGEVRERLRTEGPLTARELGGAKRGGPWWDWSEIKIAAEWLLDIGEVVVRRRRGFQRVYDLTERAVPDELAQSDWTDEACALRLLHTAGHALGVATVADLAAYNGVPQAMVRQVLGASDLRPVQVEGWGRTAYAAPGALDVLGQRVKGRTILVSPFDSLIWFRPRAERLFGIRHRFEAYVPRHKRTHGYFAMPVLAGSRIVGLVDPGRSGDTLVAKQVTLHTAAAAGPVARALLEAARWVGSTNVVVERVEPEAGKAELRGVLARAM